MTEVIVPDEAGSPSWSYDVGGLRLARYIPYTAADVKRFFDGVPTYRLRDDDVMLCAFPKCGTNWMFEILSLMLTKKTDLVNYVKLQTMLEAAPPEKIDAFPSPRVLNTHLSYRLLPADMKTKQTKTVLLLRNPKDVACSYYKHYTGVKLANYSGQWKDWLPVYLRGEYDSGKYTDYLRSWQEAFDTEVGFPLHIVYYEDLKKNCMTELQTLAEFLGLSLSEDLLADIMKTTGFENMKAKKMDTVPAGVSEAYFWDHFKFFRKGQVADWKNHFTVQQNEMFDEIWTKESGGFTFQFQYE